MSEYFGTPIVAGAPHAAGDEAASTPAAPHQQYGSGLVTNPGPHVASWTQQQHEHHQQQQQQQQQQQEEYTNYGTNYDPHGHASFGNAYAPYDLTAPAPAAAAPAAAYPAHHLQHHNSWSHNYNGQHWYTNNAPPTPPPRPRHAVDELARSQQQSLAMQLQAQQAQNAALHRQMQQMQLHLQSLASPPPPPHGTSPHPRRSLAFNADGEAVEPARPDRIPPLTTATAY